MTSEQTAKIRVPVILGPTAAGKTDLAMRLSLDLGTEILSCDSRQIYRGMDVGTAKPSPGQQRMVRHWMVDIIEPDRRYSCWEFARDALEIIRGKAREGKRLLVCGGSGLYFKSLSEGIGPHVGPMPGFREEYREKARLLGPGALFDELARIDPQTASKSHPSNVARNIRALEAFYGSGTPLSELKKKARPPEDIEFFTIVCSLPRPALYARIDGRVDEMIKNGLWDEFMLLRKKGYDQRTPGMQCVGYKELFAVEKGQSPLGVAADEIKKNSRNYAKRQITWLRHQVKACEAGLLKPDYEGIKKIIEGFIYNDYS